MNTFYGSTKLTTGETDVINLHLKIIVFMSFLFFRHVWRRRILKYLRDKGLQRYGWQVHTSITVLFWPRFYRAKGVTFKRRAKFIKPLWTIQRLCGSVEFGDISHLLPVNGELIACCYATDNEERIIIFVT
jgi:hypothetical protein